MSVESVATLSREALWVCLCVCGPLLVATTVVGLMVSVLQAVTQINEGSLVFSAKLLTSLGLLLYLGSWMLSHMVSFVIATVGNVPS